MYDKKYFDELKSMQSDRQRIIHEVEQEYGSEDLSDDCLFMAIYEALKPKYEWDFSQSDTDRYRLISEMKNTDDPDCEEKIPA